MQIDGKLWQLAKHSVGTRSSRKRGSKKPGGIRAITRINTKYQEFLAEIHKNSLRQSAIDK